MRLDANLRKFFNSKASITEQMSNNAFKVKVSPFYKNWKKSKNENNEVQYCREVTISLDNKKAWYAKSVLSENSYKQKKKYFDELGNNAIGHFLFSSKEVTRISLSYSLLKQNTSLYAKIFQHYSLAENWPLWQRHSIFLISGEVLEITEIFLPSLLEFI